jgi:hypothetical protein
VRKSAQFLRKNGQCLHRWFCVNGLIINIVVFWVAQKNIFAQRRLPLTAISVPFGLIDYLCTL